MQDDFSVAIENTIPPEAVPLVTQTLVRGGEEVGVRINTKDGKRLETMRRSRSIRPTVFDWIREDQSGKKRLLESAETGILVLVGHVFYAR